MATRPSALCRDLARQQLLRDWAARHGLGVDCLDPGQQWVLFAALQVLSVIGPVAVLRRVLGYLLLHCGMGLSAPVVAAVVGVSDRALRTTQTLSPGQLVAAVRRPGNRKPKLRAEQAGPIARFLVEHPGIHQDQLLAFIRQTWKLKVDRTTLSRYLARYGLGCLRDLGSGAPRATPLLSAIPTTAAPLC